MIIGVLALQGDYERHMRQLEAVGAKPVLVRLPENLNNLQGLIIPGGESTTMSILIDRFKLREPLTRFGAEHPIYGTCAGMIMLSKTVAENHSDVNPLGLMDIELVRNGYGRQVFSFDTTVDCRLGEHVVPVTASFIRAPRVTRLGQGIEVLARFNGDPVLLRQNHLLAASFHAELDDDTRLLEYFLAYFVADNPKKKPILQSS
ncbi:MAG: pyridoxal 5'-phosphate synthase glutaminase subunit PdxT [Candidatus Zixiibacteriota bacterium]|nr:MAG: pyridoxal 5'-phosphate synthase glutaminase subunit PdxT [candidate division Zixibacteria bacterium]